MCVREEREEREDTHKFIQKIESGTPFPACFVESSEKEKVQYTTTTNYCYHLTAAELRWSLRVDDDTSAAAAAAVQDPFKKSLICQFVE